MKLLIETTGSFGMLAERPDQNVPWNRPAVRESSHFTQINTGNGKLRVLGQVNEEATDQEFVKYWNEAGDDRDLAIQSFLAAFPLEPPAAPKTKAKKPEAE